MVKTWFRCGVSIVSAVMLLATMSTAAEAGPKPGARRKAMNLFAGSLGRINVNRWDCGLDARGFVCVDPFGSTTVGGGFWPRGTPDQYVFNSGLQVAGKVDPAAGFTWAGDITGAFFFDPKGTTEHGERLTQIYSSLNTADAANWPEAARVPSDPALFSPILFNRDAASQQDTWVRYWDGNPANNAGRSHPLGIMVDQRSMAWNFPTGNEDIIYFLYTFTNVTASTRAPYDIPGRRAVDVDSLEAWGKRFQDLNERAFGVAIPDGGYTFKDLFAAFAADMDVGAAREDFSTAFLPFNMGTAFKGNFFDAAFTFPPDAFGAPFAKRPGFVGVKYLKSPLNPLTGQEVGLTMFSNTINGGQFDDAQTTTQLYRYLSASLDPGAGDAPCSIPDPNAKGVCFVTQVTDDIRFFQSSGPFDLAPGQQATIVVAYIGAAPVDLPVIAAFGSSSRLPPGIPAQPDSLALGTDTLRTVDRIMGAVSVNDANGDSKIEQSEVVTVPRSLLNKGLTAQAVFDGKFLLPSAPESPEFFLVPGDNQVTIAWRASGTDIEGDPFYVAAKDSLNPDGSDNTLFNHNFRRADVEGYRIYRGRTAAGLQLIAQFDKTGTTFIDFTAEINYGNCAPELGVFTDCPADLATGHEVPLVGDIVQVPVGKRALLAGPDSSIIVTEADTAVINTACPSTSNLRCPPLRDTGVPFVFIDRGVRNSFTYIYQVTAFDVNSRASGQTSLESQGVNKTVTPRKSGTNIASRASFSVLGAFRGDGTPIDPNATYPAIDAATGTFNGIMPPSNTGSVALPNVVAEALALGDITVTIDSLSGGFAEGIGAAGTIFMSVASAGGTVHMSAPLLESSFAADPGTTTDFTVSAPAVAYDRALAKTFGMSTSFVDSALMPLNFVGTATPIVETSGAIAVTSGRFGVGSTASRYLAHSRWFDEGGTEAPDPTIVGLPDSAHNAGKLTGVGRIWAPQAYRDRPSARQANLLLRGYSYSQTAWYPADFVVTWNADSSLTVRDSTHRTTLPFGPNGGSGWGFMNLRSFAAAGVTTPEIEDGSGTPSVSAALGYHHIYATKPTCYPDWFAITCAQLERKAQFEPVDFNFDGTADGNGIGLMINGEAFIMEMNAIPAAGTRWHLRAVTGDMSATCAPGLGPVMTDCSGYTFSGAAVRPAIVPGVQYLIRVTQQYAVDSSRSGDLSRIHTVPDPYYVTNALEQSPTTKRLRFVNLPNRAIIRIYSLSGILVAVVTHNDPTGGGEAEWNLRNRNNQFVASGVYFYHVETSDGKKKIGRFTVVNFAQ